MVVYTLYATLTYSSDTFPRRKRNRNTSRSPINGPSPSRVRTGKWWIRLESQTSKVTDCLTLTLSDQYGYTSNQLHGIIFKNLMGILARATK